MGGVLRSDPVSPVTTSIGRLFDAVGALCGIAPRASYEGQAAVELEWAAAAASDRGSYELSLDGSVIDPRSAIRAIDADLRTGDAVADVAVRFHRGIADVTARACAQLASQRGLGTVVLSGGVFLNRLLADGVRTRLESAGLRVLMPRVLPPGDGAIAFGQAAIAAARIAA
jgi:hydrogenase maturation protein HypF